MTIFAPLIVPFFLGAMVLLLTLQGSRLPNKTILILSAAPALGLGVTSLIVFWSYLLAGHQGRETAVFTTLALCVALSALFVAQIFTRNSKNQMGPPHGVAPSPPDSITLPLGTIFSKWLGYGFFALLILILFLYLRYFLALTVADAFGGWDARYFWSLKAKFFFRDPGEWKRMFDPIVAWTHTDYPLLLPGSLAWGWNWMNREAFIWPPMVSLTFLLPLCGLLFWYLKSFVSQNMAFLAVAFLISIEGYRFWPTAQYADVPLAFFITGAAVFLVCALRFNEKRLFLISGLLAGLTTWTKNEGLAFTAWMVLILIPILWSSQKRSKKESVSFFIFFCLGLSLPLMTTLVLKFFLDTTGNEFVSTHRDSGEILAMLSSVWRWKVLGMTHVFMVINVSNWLGLWALFIGSACLGITRVTKDEHWILFLLTFLVLATYFMVLLITPDLRLEIATALGRLALHVGVLALIFTCSVLGKAPLQK